MIRITIGIAYFQLPHSYIFTKRGVKVQRKAFKKRVNNVRIHLFNWIKKLNTTLV